MRVKDLQEFLAKFTEAKADGSRQGNAISNAVIFVEQNGYLHEIKRMEVHEHAVPIIGQQGHTAHRLVLKTVKESPLIIVTKNFVRQELANAEGGHDWFHIERVYKNALLIAEEEDVNLDIIALGALLHDIADAKFHE